jgi:hypothetical protein
MAPFERDMIEKYGEEDADEIVVNPKEISEAVTWGTDWTVETIYNQLVKGNIALNPKFQRRNAWKIEKKSKLIESLILGLPVPEIILAENKEKRGSYIVIDGKQRLLTIRHFLANVDDTDFKPFNLTKLKILKELNGKNYRDIGQYPIFSQHKTALDNQAIRTVIIKNWKNDDFLFSIFYRLNTGSEPLAPQELRQALHPGPFVDFIDEFAQNSQGIQRMLGLSGEPDGRMRDTEMAIRYLAFKLLFESYDGNLKQFLDNCCLIMNKSWADNESEIRKSTNELESAITMTYSIFGKNSFSKYQLKFSNKFNRAVFDIMVYYFSNPVVREKSEKKKELIKLKFIDLCKNDPDFLNSFGAGTKDIDKTIKRFGTWGSNLSKIINHPLATPKTHDGKITIS